MEDWLQRECRGLFGTIVLAAKLQVQLCGLYLVKIGTFVQVYSFFLISDLNFGFFM